MNLDERLLRQARQSRLALFLTIAAGFAAGIFTILQAGAISRIVTGAFLEGQGLEQLGRLLKMLLLLIFLRAGLAWGSEISANAIAARLKTALRARLYAVLLDVGPVYTSSESAGELTSVFLEGVEALDAYYSQYLPQLVLAALVPLTFLVFVFPIDWISGLVLLLTAPLIPLFMILIGSLAQSLTRRQWQTLSRMNAYFLDVLQGLGTLKIFARSGSQVQGIAQVSERYRLVTMSVLRITFLSALALEMVATLSTAVVAVEVGLRLLYGRMAFEQAFFVLLLAPEFYLPLRLLGTRFHAGISGVTAANRIFEILEQASPLTPGTTSPDVLPLPDRLESIRLENVLCRYGTAQPALQDVSLEIPAGTTVALVGPSGAGKSTIANVLLRFLEPQQGQVLLNGQPLSAYLPQEWRRLVAWAPQRPYLFQATIAENISLGKPGATLEEITQAARQAQAHDFIQALPRGYQTLLGERGAGLSAGQAQRISLARAFLKDAPFVILDEVAANLDPETEADLHQAITALLHGRTALIIAHRLSTVTLADQVIVLKGGRVCERGRPADLAESGGLYSQLLQAYRGPGAALAWTPAPILEEPQPERRPIITETSLLPAPATLQVYGSDGAVGQQSSWRVFARLLALVRPFMGMVFLSALAGFATVASGIGLMGASAYLISAAALQPSIAVLQVTIVGVRFFGISRGVFRYLERYLSHQVTFRLLGRLRLTFYQALEPLAPARLARYRSGDLLARISGDIESLENFYVRALAPPVVALLVGLLAGILLWNIAGRDVALVFVFFYLLAGIGVPLCVRFLGRRPARLFAAQRPLYSAAVVDGILGLADLLSFNQGELQAERLQGVNRAMVSAQQRLALINGLQNALVTLFSHLGMWAVLVAAIPLVGSGALDGVYLAVVALVTLASFEAVLPLPLAAQVLEGNLYAARRLYEIVDAQPEVLDPVQPLPAPLNFGITAQSLGFTYPLPLPTSNRLVDITPYTFSLSSPGKTLPSVLEQVGVSTLEEISFALQPGKKLALVGPSGSGKSTLVNLLLRFWEYRQGSLLLAGEEFRRYRQDDIRASMAVVSQNMTIFHTTLRENLLLARPKATQVELEQAIELAQLSALISALPQGLDARVGEGGARLSAGQRQRLAVARAILKDAPLLLLDEPAANLDALTERALLQGLFAGLGDRSLLYISHRLVGMEQMDEILVMSAGRIVERGNHAALLAQHGRYWQMLEIQRQLIV